MTHETYEWSWLDKAAGVYPPPDILDRVVAYHEHAGKMATVLVLAAEGRKPCSIRPPSTSCGYSPPR